MTRDDFIPRLESYLDEYEGATPLPESVRVAVRVELPRTKQVRSIGGLGRYTSMVSTRTAQVALGLAAAALIVAVGAFLYSGRDVGQDNASASPTATPATSEAASVAPSVEPSAAAACEATDVTASAGVIDVTWCAYGVGEPDDISFTMDGPEEWTDQHFSGFGSLWLRPESGGSITFALVEDQTVDEVVADLSTRNGYAAANESATTVGGKSATVLELSLADGAAADDAQPLIDDPDLDWRLQSGTFTRAWIVDLDGSTVMILAGESLAEAVADSLQTVEWGS